MARPTRQQRRDRRAQQPALAGPGGAPPTPPARPTERGGGGDEYERRQRTSENVSRGGPFRFFHESYGELKKVEWPDQKAVISGTVVVIVACVIVGAYLWLNDRLWSYVVQHVLLH